ncbi:MAG TPA: hypothetical protein VEC19_10635 [Usitatibacter sp.]|nr:hypothetical protein [Usitatibacter sp.]
MPKIIRPLDWQTTNRRPIFHVDRADSPGALRLSVAEKDEYFATGVKAAVRFSAVIPADHGPLAIVRVSERLADGFYVAYVAAEDAPENVLTLSGFAVQDMFDHLQFPIRDAAAEREFRITVMDPNLAPMAIKVSRDASRPRRLNIVLPALEKARLSGGPNTALALGQVLADRGIPVNFVSSDLGVERDHKVLRDHLEVLTGIRDPKAAVTFTPGHEPRRAVTIGHADIMLGTAWWTVQKFAHCLPELRTPRFVYLIQEFEPALYPYSTKYALAEETYRMDHLAIFNHRFLHDFFRSRRIGAFADDGRARPEATWFDPVIDTRQFHYDEEARRGSRRTLLFYARPTTAPRNLFEIGYAALVRLTGEGVIDEQWNIQAMGEDIGDYYLPGDLTLEQLNWMGFHEYARRMRSCDVLLSLMLSPHPSYPPLEGAASGAIVVTNEFANKTAAEFAAISRNIIATAPSMEAVTAGIRAAVARLDDHDGRREASRLAMPGDWVSTVSTAADRIVDFWKATA